jgi:hypothetical protein
VALVIDNNVGLSAVGHGLTIKRWTAEAYYAGINVLGTGNTVIDISMATEVLGSVYDINDTANVLKGEFRYYSPEPATLVVNGAENLRIIDRRYAPGNVTAPSVPATTVDHRNVFWRDAAVNIVGGTVTVIAVDGVATGLTAGTVIVPSGRTITLTYSRSTGWSPCGLGMARWPTR